MSALECGPRRDKRVYSNWTDLKGVNLHRGIRDNVSIQPSVPGRGLGLC